MNEWRRNGMSARRFNLFGLVQIQLGLFGDVCGP
jgi:hypothetical protein